jgi:hypothetical protein
VLTCTSEKTGEAEKAVIVTTAHAVTNTSFYNALIALTPNFKGMDVTWVTI